MFSTPESSRDLVCSLVFFYGIVTAVYQGPRIGRGWVYPPPIYTQKGSNHLLKNSDLNGWPFYGFSVCFVFYNLVPQSPRGTRNFWKILSKNGTGWTVFLRIYEIHFFSFSFAETWPVIFEIFYLKMAQGGRFFYGFMKFIFLVSVSQKLYW